jgi:hypothetical protein
MRIWTAILGVTFIVAAFFMTSWHFKGETREREPNFEVRLTTFCIGICAIALAFWWPFS